MSECICQFQLSGKFLSCLPGDRDGGPSCGFDLTVFVATLQRKSYQPKHEKIYGGKCLRKTKTPRDGIRPLCILICHESKSGSTQICPETKILPWSNQTNGLLSSKSFVSIF